jgi:hypothetical protein
VLLNPVFLPYGAAQRGVLAGGITIRVARHLTLHNFRFVFFELSATSSPSKTR